jgi:hypothetical protein
LNFGTRRCSPAEVIEDDATEALSAVHEHRMRDLAEQERALLAEA